MKSSSPIRLGFIVSTGRTGTMALAHYFNQYEGVIAHHEPIGSYRLNVLSNLARDGRISNGMLASAIRALRSRRLGQSNFDAYIESNPWMHGCVQALDVAFPAPEYEVFLIHVSRHPVDYLISAINNGSTTGKKLFASKHIPYWSHRSRVKECGSREYSPSDPRLKLLWQWNSINEHLQLAGELMGARYIHLRFEDLIASGGRLSELTQWMGIAAHPKQTQPATGFSRMNASRTGRMEGYENWDIKLKSKLHEICLETATKLGYRLPPR